MSIGRAWRTVWHPRVLLPVLLAAALFMVAISLGDLGQVVDRVKAVPLGSMTLVLGFAALYLVFKGLQLHLLLNDLEAHPGWRRFGLAFAVGELALTFPLGIFAQNWVLAGKKGMHFGRSSAATVVMLVMEVVVALLWLAINGVPGWEPVRPVAAAMLGGMAIFGFALLRFRLLDRLATRMAHHRVHRILDEGLGLLHGLEKLGKWRIFGINLLVTATYLGALGAAFWVMGHGMGLQNLSYHEAATIYAFALASVLVSGGLFGQIGTVEVIGMSAARAWGLDYTGGLALMLGFRLAWTGSMWLLNGMAVAALWRKVPMSVDGRQKSGH
ncbi:MAG TPA: lysylphosphatidylglycerol synthase domain-containing protein [Rhodanobacteraceae bacterium]|nr:lysylphosphatidylglycerol synthase domain-containing protein [Rhodanobacteraceae bacterium]